MDNASTEPCRACQRPAQPGFDNPLCSECRSSFVRYPIPAWLKVGSGCLVVLVVFGLTRVPGQLHDLRDWRAARNAVDAGRPRDAIPVLERLHEKHATSDEIEGWLAAAQLDAGDFEASKPHLDHLRSGSTSKDIVKLLNERLDRIAAQEKRS